MVRSSFEHGIAVHPLLQQICSINTYQKENKMTCKEEQTSRDYVITVSNTQMPYQEWIYSQLKEIKRNGNSLPKNDRNTKIRRHHCWSPLYQSTLRKLILVPKSTH